MKNNLGRVFLVLLLSLELFASSYEWSVEVDRERAVTNEPIYLKYICRFSDSAQTYSIEFNPTTDNDDYRVLLLSENESVVDAKRVNTYEYILYVKKAQKLKLFFDTTMKKTNRDSIENSVLGRDNAEYEDYSIRVIRQDSVELEIEDAKSLLVGRLSGELKRDESSIKAYEPYHLEFRLEGRANFDALKALHLKVDGVKVIEEKPKKELELTKDGFTGSWSQKFALVSDASFKIPKIEIEYFDLDEKRLKLLGFDEIDVEVEKLYKKEQLLDAKPKSSFEIKYEYFYYLLFFIAGFILAKIEFKKRVKPSSKEIIFNQKIEDAKSLDALVFLLVLEDAKRYDRVIKSIEKKEIISLREAKEALL